MNKQMTYTRADGMRFEYNGSLTVNVYKGSNNVDCFTLGLPVDQHTIASITRKMDSWVDWSTA